MTCWPNFKGFDEFYDFLGGETNQWTPGVYHNLNRIETPDDPDYHFTNDMAAQAINWIRFQQSLTPTKPDDIKDWADLSADEKKLFARQAEVFAAYLAMAEALGPVRYAGPAGAGYLGDQAAARNLSPDIANLIDVEIRRLLDGAFETASELLSTHVTALREIARVLQEDEVIDGDTVSRIVAEQG